MLKIFTYFEVVFLLFCPSDPEQPFVVPHPKTFEVFYVFRDESTMVVPCRTSSPDTVVKLVAVRSLKSHHTN